MTIARAIKRCRPMETPLDLAVATCGLLRQVAVVALVIVASVYRIHRQPSRSGEFLEVLYCSWVVEQSARLP